MLEDSAVFGEVCCAAGRTGGAEEDASVSSPGTVVARRGFARDGKARRDDSRSPGGKRASSSESEKIFGSATGSVVAAGRRPVDTEAGSGRMGSRYVGEAVRRPTACIVADRGAALGRPGIPIGMKDGSGRPAPELAGTETEPERLASMGWIRAVAQGCQGPRRVRVTADAAAWPSPLCGRRSAAREIAPVGALTSGPVSAALVTPCFEERGAGARGDFGRGVRVEEATAPARVPSPTTIIRMGSCAFSSGSLPTSSSAPTTTVANPTRGTMYDPPAAVVGEGEGEGAPTPIPASAI